MQALADKDVFLHMHLKGGALTIVNICWSSGRGNWCAGVVHFNVARPDALALSAMQGFEPGGS